MFDSGAFTKEPEEEDVLDPQLDEDEGEDLVKVKGKGKAKDGKATKGEKPKS